MNNEKDKKTRYLLMDYKINLLFKRSTIEFKQVY